MMIPLPFIAALGANLVFSALAGAFARQWSVSGNIWHLGAGIVLNVVGFVALAWLIRVAGLGIGTSVALLATIIVNTSIAMIWFHEPLGNTQMAGIALGLVALGLMVFK